MSTEKDKQDTERTNKSEVQRSGKEAMIEHLSSLSADKLDKLKSNT